MVGSPDLKVILKVTKSTEVKMSVFIFVMI